MAVISKYLLRKNYKVYGIIRRNSWRASKNRIEDLDINTKVI